MVFGCGLAPMLASAQPVVWVTSSLQRTGPSDSAGSGTQAQISAGKGEYESFQIVVRGPASGLSNANVTVSDLSGPGGAIIPKTSFTLFSEHYVFVSPGSVNWGGSNQPLGAGWYPDGLVPFTDPTTGASLSGSGAAIVAVPFSLGANSNQPIWVDLLVPRSAVAGQYSGTFTVSSNQGSTSGTISLTVWNFTLPLTPTLRSSFQYWNASGLAADEELVRNKLEPIHEAPSEQSTLMNSYGLGDVGLPFFSGANHTNCNMTPAPSVSQFQASMAAQQPGLSAYIWSVDEIPNCTNVFPTLIQWGYNMHQAGIKNLATMAPVAALFSDGSGTGRSAVDVWAMLPVIYDGATSLVAQAMAKGDSAWSYNALVQDAYTPKWEIDFAPLNFRIQPGFISQSLGLTGLAAWRVDAWNASDPWNQVNNVGTYSTNNYPGEGQFVYPGWQVGIQGVAPSMRLKWLRDGVEDYEYVAMLKALGQSSQALSLAQSVGANWTTWTRDPNQLLSVRQQLGQLLDQLGGGSAPSTPSLSSPSNGATGLSLTQALSWSASNGATSYDVYFGTGSPPALVTNTASTSYSPAGLSASTTYYWKVIAKNSTGTASSAIWSLTTGSAVPPPPGAPANPNPASGTPAVSLSPTLSWSAGANATSYDVYFGTSSPPALVTNTASTSYSPAGLNAGTTYYWEIIAKNSTGTAFSAIWSFTTSTGSSSSVPPKPVNPAPASGATGVSLTAALSWGAATGATSYDVYFGTSSPLPLVATVTGTTYTPATLAANTTYTWGVVAKNSTGSDSSAGWTFTTGAAVGPPPPGAPANPNPASGATAVSLSPTLSWSAGANATSYDVYFGASSPPALVTNTPGASYAPAGLSASTTYYWKVIAKNSTGTASSAIWSFTTSTGSSSSVPPKPVNPSPASGGTGVSVNTALSWGAATGATSYDVYFGTSSPPPLVVSVPGTTYTPATLAPNTTYYWGVVAKNSAGSDSSAGWTFTTGLGSAGPAAVSVSPSSGSASAATLMFTYSDSNGFADLAGVGALINTTVSGTNACWFYYDRSSSTLSLASDNAASWTALPQGGTVQNSQCSISSATASGSGLNFTLTVTFTFKTSVTRTIYGVAQSKGGLSSGYQPLGTRN